MQELVDQLSHSKSEKRRSAARQLRKAKVLEAGPALLLALQREVRDTRTWETQYQMIMALGDCGYREALPVLEQLAAEEREATIVNQALGYAIVLLKRASQHDATPVLELLASGNQTLITGALTAVAMTKMVPDPEACTSMLRYASASGDDDMRSVAIAAAGWRGPEVDAFLARCLTSDWNLVREAAELAKKGRYDKLSPL